MEELNLKDLKPEPPTKGEKTRRPNRSNFVLINVIDRNRREILNTDYVKRVYTGDDGVTRLEIHDEGSPSYTIKVEQNIVDMFKKLRGVAI